ncbi:TetR/AcrR family transcriptional regulator [Nocardia wallacei]|uniref:TetR/AcrR family transcriptional regulator n=1 Tax=Nocardia wallacei TaxID=480035 RepID=UPI002453D2EC|nr:TetR/AcrR family transcriptional regulator [Nocardia wallacei]
MARRTDHEKREQLLAQASEILCRRGIVDTSLRTLATEMGTSARMLIYYFGSKEQLLLDVLALHRQQVTPSSEDLTSPAGLRAWAFADWESMMRGEKRIGVRIQEQIFGAACAQDSPYAAYTSETLTQLIRNLEAMLRAIGMPAELAATRADITINALQGLVMRYCTAEDPTLIDRSFRRLIDDLLLAPF